MNRRGSAIVEAAVVMPVVILAVIACVLIGLYFSQGAVETSRMHMALREEADQMAAQGKGLFQTVTKKETITMNEYDMIRGKYSEELESAWHVADGVSYVRYCTLTRKLTERR